MLDMKDDGRLQTTAAVSLLESSLLVRWDRDSGKFWPESEKAFESRWRNEVNPVFGRLICWINFSAGAEFLAKGVCLLRGVDVRKAKQVPAPPRRGDDLHSWATRFLATCPPVSTLSVTSFGTLGDLIGKERTGYVGGPLDRLCDEVRAGSDERHLLLAAYCFLAKTIRNRDAHAYVPSVRGDQFWLVPELFSMCFNVLASWLPGGPCTLSEWIEQSKDFASALSA